MTDDARRKAHERAVEIIRTEDELVLLHLGMKLVNGSRGPDLIKSMIRKYKDTTDV